MSQTSYARNFVNAFAGMLGESGFKYIQTRVNASGSDLPAGIGMKSTSTDGNADVPSAATDALEGIVLNSFARDPGSAGNALSGSNVVKASNEVNLLSEGTVFVKPEQVCAVTDPVYVRIASSVNTPSLTQKGSFRKDADGVAQVSTGTPTAANSTDYTVRVHIGGKTYEFSVTSSGSATATTIVTQLKTAMAADAEFTAKVVATGTATLILTGQVAGQSFTTTTDGDGVIAWVATTPAAATARQVKAARYLHAQGTTGVQMLYFSAALDAAMLATTF